MLSNQVLAILPIGVLLGGALLQLLLHRALSAQAKGWLAFLSSLPALGAVLALWPATAGGAAVAATYAAWDGPARLAYHVDALSLLFAGMATGIGASVLLYSVSYMAGDPGATRFYALMLIFIAGLVHTVFSADLLLLYLGWEVIGLCSFLLVGFWYRLPEAAYGARKVLVMTHLAGYGLLAAILLLLGAAGTTDWSDPAIKAAFTTPIFFLMFLAAVAKSVQFPLHTWIPEAMAAPTPVSALLHAACYVKAGVYLVARLHTIADPWPAEWQVAVIWVGTITLLVGSLYAMVQSDLKRLLAFSTVSQIGYMILGLGLGTPLGIAAALLHCLNHGLFKGGLFLCAGSVQHATGTRDMDRLGGLQRYMPRTAWLWLVGAGSIAGVPLLSGFASKWLIYNAALEAGQLVPGLISWVASVLTVFYFLKATNAVFLGEDGPESAGTHEAALPMQWGIGALAAGSVLLGVAPQLAFQYVINPVLATSGASSGVQVSWLGLTTGSGAWFATGGLIMATVALGTGLLFYWLSRPAPQVVAAGATAGGGVFTGGEPLSGSGRLPARDFSLIIQEGMAPFYRWTDADRLYLWVWRQLLNGVAALARASDWLEDRITLTLPALAITVAGIAALGLLSMQFNMHGPVEHTGEPPAPLFAGVAVALAGLLVSCAAVPGARRALPLLAVAGVLSLVSLAVKDTMLRFDFLEAASLVAILLVWQTDAGRGASRAYLVALLSSTLAMVAGLQLLNDASPAPGWALPFLLVGLAIKLAVVPLYLWLPRVVEGTPAPVAGLVIAVVDVAAFSEMLALRQTAAWLFDPVAPWLALALLSALGGGLLMLAQRDLKRLLAFSTIEDMGFLLMGVTLAGDVGLIGAILGAAVHALGKGLLFASLTQVDAEGELPHAGHFPLVERESRHSERSEESLRSTSFFGVRGLASRYPLAGVGFLAGALAVVGVPPLAGYAAHWRLYSVAAATHPLLLAVLVGCTGLAILAYARAVALAWWGPGTGERRATRQAEAPMLVLAIMAIMLGLLALGLWPALWGML